MFEADIKQTDPMTVAYLHMRGEYDRIPQGFDTVYRWVSAYEHTPQGMPEVVYLTPPADEEHEWEVWAPIEGGAIQFGPDRRGLGVKQVEPATVASTMHKGPYENLSAAYERLTEWIGENGYVVCGAPREVYYSDPQETPPEEYLTEVQFPVRKRPES